jgi:aminopeptidase YwaD
VTTRTVPLPNGKHSLDVIAELPGQVHNAILISGHLDTHLPAPGANDDASGIAVMLEVARILHAQRPHFTILFAGFGAEERQLRERDSHHYGSRFLARDPAVTGRLAGMISLDMVGYGTLLHITNQGWAADRWCKRAATIAKAMGTPVRVYQGKPWSDHEAFERRGIPVAYLHWERDPSYHHRGDTPAHIQPERLRQTAAITLRLLLTAR